MRRTLSTLSTVTAATMTVTLVSCAQETPDTFTEGWATEFLPGTDYVAVTERGGQLKLREQASGEVREFSGVPVLELRPR